MQLFTGSPPISPDYPPNGTLLVALPLSSTAGTASLTVQSLVITNAGSGGTTGAQLVTGTTGTGTRFQASVTIAGGAIVAILGIVIAGVYSMAPTLLSNEPVSGAGLVGASLGLVLTGQLIFNPITLASATAAGVVGYARIVTAAGVGVIDLDCGTSNASVIMNTTTLALNGPVLCSAEILLEA